MSSVGSKDLLFISMRAPKLNDPELAKKCRCAVSTISRIVRGKPFLKTSAAFLLVCIEGKLEKLTAAIRDLAQVVGALKVGSFAEP